MPGLRVILRIIHLDSKRTKDKDKQAEILFQTLSEIRGRQDLIIVSDKEANQIFFSLDIPMIKKIPVVFCAVAVSDDRKQEGWENATGVVSKLDYEKVFLLGRRLFPEARKVYVISDSTESGRMHKKMAQSQLVKYERVFPIEYMGENEATVDDLIGEMENFDPLSFIILSTWQRDRQGMYRSDGSLLSYFFKGGSGADPVFDGFCRGKRYFGRIFVAGGGSRNSGGKISR